MLKIGINDFIEVDMVYGSTIEFTEKITNNLDLIRRNYKRIRNINDNFTIDSIDIFHHKDSKSSFCEIGGMLIKNIRDNNIYFISDVMLQKNKNYGNCIQDNINILTDSLKKELFKTL